MSLHAPDAELAAFISEVNAREARDYRLVRKFAGPVNSGAMLVDGSQGRRILKWLRTRDSFEAQFRAAAATDLLRAPSYPVPVYERIEPLEEGGYVLMTELLGSMARLLERGAEEAAAVIALNARHYDVHVPSRNWPEEIVVGALQGGDGYCYPAAMDATPETRTLREVGQQLARDHRDAIVPTDLIVHKDMNPSNILVIDDVITGIVDWENTTAGDPLYDLVYLWWMCHSYERARPVLWSQIVSTGPPQAVALYVAHLILSIGGAMHHRPNRPPTRQIATARAALAAIRDLGIRVAIPE